MLRFNSFWKPKRIQDWIKVLSKYLASRNQNFPFDQFQLLNCSRRSRKHLMNWQHFLELHSHHHRMLKQSWIWKENKKKLVYNPEKEMDLPTVFSLSSNLRGPKIPRRVVHCQFTQKIYVTGPLTSATSTPNCKKIWKRQKCSFKN